MTYAILRIEKAKTLADIGSRAAHNLRENDAAPHADQARKTLNKVLHGPRSGRELVELFRERIGRLAKAPRKNAVLGIELMLTASPEFFDSKRGGSADEKNAWMEASRAWLRETFGAENVISEVLHRDEKTPHLQVLVLPERDGKLKASHWLDGPKKLAELQTSYAEAVAKGTRLRRGEVGSKAKHSALTEFYKLVQRIVSSVKNDKPKDPPKLPERGILGSVSREDWTRLESDLRAYGEEGLRMRAEAIVGRFMAGSVAGNEARARAELAKKRQAEAEAALREAEQKVGVARVELAKLQQSIKDKKAELLVHESAIASALDRRQRAQKAADTVERRAGIERPGSNEVKREGR